jgi:hypothetical protein
MNTSTETKQITNSALQSALGRPTCVTLDALLGLHQLAQRVNIVRVQTLIFTLRAHSNTNMA